MKKLTKKEFLELFLKEKSNIEKNSVEDAIEKSIYYSNAINSIRIIKK